MQTLISCIFEKEGDNHRLSLYASFSYKKGPYFGYNRPIPRPLFSI